MQPVGDTRRARLAKREGYRRAYSLMLAVLGGLTWTLGLGAAHGCASAGACLLLLAACFTVRDQAHVTFTVDEFNLGQTK